MAKTAVCIASGPSLTASDCAKVEALGLYTIAVNYSWRMARFADVIYAGDPSFWDRQSSIIDIPADRWTCLEPVATKHGINLHGNFTAVGNSGARAAQFAIDSGFKRVILLGYDMSIKNGAHWYGGSAAEQESYKLLLPFWHQHFSQINLKGAEVINCSAYTELEAFKTARLDDVL
jgi:hypothetical protein